MKAFKPWTFSFRASNLTCCGNLCQVELLTQSKLFEISHQVCTTRRGLHFAIDLHDLAVLVDVKSPPLSVLSGVVQHSVTFRD